MTEITLGTTPEPLLEVNGLCKYFPVHGKGFLRRRAGDIRAVDGVSFKLFRGRTLGLVGESGSGKTTCAQTILRALKPTAGEVWFDSKRYGRINLAAIPENMLKPLRCEMQMIFQDPYSSLNPRMTVGEIVGEPLLIHGVGNSKERRARVGAMLERVGLNPGHMERYPHAFSGGQRQRIGIARSLILHPSLVVADEAVSALDVSVQAQVINLLQELQQELNLTYMFVAHDLSVVRHLCDEIAVMYKGRLVEHRETEALFAAPEHPYTKVLFSAIPSVNPDERLRPLAKEDFSL